MEKEKIYYDIEKKKILYLTQTKYEKSRIKSRLKDISNLDRFLDEKFIFTKDENGIFKKSKKEIIKAKASPKKTNDIRVKREKGKLFEPVMKNFVEDTPYNRILIKNIEKSIKKNSSRKDLLINKRVEDGSDKKEDYNYQSATYSDSRCLSLSKILLKEHQLKCVRKLLEEDTRGIIASFGVGTGKTLTAVSAAQCLLFNNIVKKVIVATPKSLLNNFKKEIVKYHYGEDYTGTVDNSLIDDFYTIITHDGIKKTYNELKEEFNREKFFLIVDEAHDLRTSLNYEKIEEKKSSYFLELALLATKVLLLTATPYVNNEGDLVNLINAVKGGVPKMITNYPDNPIEKEIFLKNTFMFFELSDESKIQAGMPSSEIFIKRFVMSPRYYNEYMDIEKGFNINWLNPTVFLSGLRRASNALEGNPKIEWVIDHVLNNNLQTIIFSSYKDSGINLIKKSFIERGIKFSEITGETIDRSKEVEKYNSGEVKIFFITKAGGTGLDLKKTREVILLESSWNNSNEEQVIGRAIRMGSHLDLPLSERHVNVYKLVLSKPVKEEDIKNNKFYKPSADELIEYLRDNKKENESKILTELREYAYE